MGKWVRGTIGINKKCHTVSPPEARGVQKMGMWDTGKRPIYPYGYSAGRHQRGGKRTELPTYPHTHVGM